MDLILYILRFQKRILPNCGMVPMRLLRKSHETNPSIFYVHILHQAVFLLIEFEVGFFYIVCTKAWNFVIYCRIVRSHET